MVSIVNHEIQSDIHLPSWHFIIMVKTQVQIPDELFRRAKEVAAQKEWSFAEIVRRGLEYMTSVHSPSPAPRKAWSLPKPCHLGRFLAREDQWTELSHEGD